MKKANINRTFDLSLKLDLVKKIERGEITILFIRIPRGSASGVAHRFVFGNRKLIKPEIGFLFSQLNLT